MLPKQVIGPRLHRLRVQIMVHPPHLPRLGSQRRAARYQAEQVLPFHRIEPRVPIIRDQRAIKDRHRIRFQMVIQRLGQTKRVPIAGQIAMRHLSCRMDPRISAACGGDGMGAW